MNYYYIRIKNWLFKTFFSEEDDLISHQINDIIRLEEEIYELRKKLDIPQKEFWNERRNKET